MDPVTSGANYGSVAANDPASRYSMRHLARPSGFVSWLTTARQNFWQGNERPGCTNAIQPIANAFWRRAVLGQFFTALHLDVAHLVAGLLTAFYAGNRFATPRTVRSETTRFQYFSSYVMYVVSCIGLLMFLSWILAHKPALLGLLYSGTPIPDELKGLDAPLVAALVLTTLLPSVPVLRDVDACHAAVFSPHGGDTSRSGSLGATDEYDAAYDFRKTDHGRPALHCQQHASAGFPGRSAPARFHAG
jgi:hypothetical protein